MTARVGVATCADRPELDEDGPLLLAALRAAGLEPVVGVWDDPAVGWPGLDLVLVRSVWDYPRKHDAFLRWVRSCRRTVNPADVLVWNTDKAYLDDLAAAGLPTVPTRFLAPGEAFEAPAHEHVVKPSVSGSAADTGRFPAGSDQGATLVARLHAQGRTAMVQPYLDGIERDGETSLLFLGGTYSHARRREPLLAQAGAREAVVVDDVLLTVRPTEPTPEQRAVAEAALDAVPGGRGRLAYGRVDLVPGRDGPVLLELELTDCFLFLRSATPQAVARLAASVAAAL
ncbi:MAG: Glutathione synthase/RimK-type ligase, ATP-grasp superfamily [Frankiales bacterium]|nr:Glutathione synthase/RimK-type ligase, ATP-grasp superfamily [Frankiales bacterium]